METTRESGTDEIAVFTNISHEFRTPLTLILTPLGFAHPSAGYNELKQKLTVIYRNAEKLLKLVNQLLDFRKLEMQGERLSLTMGDMVQFVNEACEAFRELTTERGIDLVYEERTEHLYMYYDHGQSV